MKFFSLVILFLGLLSCSDMKKGKQLEEITALQTDLDSLESVWNVMDLQRIDSMGAECSSKIDSIGLLYENQTIDESLAFKIDLFKRCTNDLKELKKIHEFYPVVLEEKRKSLKLLKTDVAKGSGRREKYEEYIDFEQKELSTIRKQYEDYQVTKQRCEAYYSESKETVDQLLDSLKINYQNKSELAR